MSRRPRTSGLLALGAAIVLPRCTPPPATTPLRTVRYHSVVDAGPRACLLVLLPGLLDRSEDFERHGFVSTLRQAGIMFDVIAADAHIGYYLDNTVVERLWEDVLAPARRHGYRHVWLAAISMGALGALAVAQRHPEAVDGLVLLGPYPGPDAIVDEISTAGGLATWHERDASDSYQRSWAWLQGYGSHRVTRPPMFVGFGADDRFERGERLLAAVLPADHVRVLPGGHAWEVWQLLWTAFVGEHDVFAGCRGD